MSEVLNSLPAEGGDRRTFREALHFLAVEIEVRRVALLPDVNATRLDLEPLRFVQTAGDEREDPKGYGVEEDVGVSGGADADVGARWGLHGSLEGRAEARRRWGKGEERAVEWLGSRRSEGDLMARDYIYDLASHRRKKRL